MIPTSRRDMLDLTPIECPCSGSRKAKAGRRRSGSPTTPLDAFLEMDSPTVSGSSGEAASPEAQVRHGLIGGPPELAPVTSDGQLARSCTLLQHK